MINQIRRSYEKDSFLTGMLDDFRLREERDRNYVNAFCRKFGLSLIGIDCTFERGGPELMYVFNDGCGGYTLEGVIGSLM